MIKSLEESSSMTEQACDQEQDCIDNTPENLQYTERFEEMEDTVDKLQDAISLIGEARECILAAIS